MSKPKDYESTVMRMAGNNPWTKAELDESASRLRSLALDAAADNFAELQRVKVELAAAYAKLDAMNSRTFDYPTAWTLTRMTKIEQHHEKCSYRVGEGGILCDCVGIDAFEIMVRGAQDRDALVKREAAHAAVEVFIAAVMAGAQEMLAQRRVASSALAVKLALAAEIDKRREGQS